MNWLPDPRLIESTSFLWGMGYGIITVLALAWYIWLVHTMLNKK